MFPPRPAEKSGIFNAVDNLLHNVLFPTPVSYTHLRDYYWGRYGNSQAWAQKDFDRRVDDYQQLYHAEVKHTELGPEVSSPHAISLPSATGRRLSSS